MSNHVSREEALRVHEESLRSATLLPLTERNPELARELQAYLEPAVRRDRVSPGVMTDQILRMVERHLTVQSKDDECCARTAIDTAFTVADQVMRQDAEQASGRIEVTDEMVERVCDAFSGRGVLHDRVRSALEAVLNG